jgi:hypothetical protein
MAHSRLAIWSSAIAQNILATALLGIFGVVAVWLAKLTPVVARYAPLSYFFTFLAAVIVLLILANLGVALFHRFNPPPVPPANMFELDHKQRIDFSADAEARIAALEEKDKVIIQDYQTVLGKLAQAEERHEALDKALHDEFAEHEEYMSKCYTAQDEARLTGQSHLKGEIEAIRAGCAGLKEQIDILFLALQAIRAINIEGKLAAAIQDEGKFLNERVDEGQPVKGDDWLEWQRHHTTFESALAQWTLLAKGWDTGVDRALGEARGRDLTDKQTEGIDALFDGSKAVIVYTSFAHKFERWKVFRSHVTTALSAAAFGGPKTAATVRKGGLAALMGFGDGGVDGSG